VPLFSMATPMVPLWPLRGLGLLALDSWTLQISTAGCLLGVFLAAIDVSAVWMAAHWGAAYAVRHPGYFRAMLNVLGRAIITLFTPAIWVYVACMTALAIRLSNLRIEVLIFSIPGFVLLWLMFPMRRAVLLAISEFRRYDRLAQDESELTG
jgi:hypothetical protein